MPKTEQVQPEQMPYQEPAPVTIVKEPLKILLTWKAPIRPFKKRNREYFTTAGSIIFLICIILLFVKEFLLVLALIALSFLVYIMGTVEPEEVEHKLTNKGIITLGKTYFWEQLGRFWFEKKFNDEVLMIENFIGIPSRLMLLLGKQDKIQIKAILDKYLLQEKPELSQVEKMSKWLGEKVPLETNPAAKPQNSQKTKK
ncbi:hypothetical protein GYA49_03625 [Candidatus Beckwithbacteria bacterium]|nr:hypothetical protein [Candidatus Beckwithbacteria bacterium]